MNKTVQTSVLTIIMLMSIFLLNACAPDQVEQTTAVTTETQTEQQETPSEDTSTADAPEDSDTSEEIDTFASVAPASDIKYQSVSVCDDVITMNIPDAITYDQPTCGSEFNQYGDIMNEDGNEIFCRFYVTRVFQVEEPVMDYDIFSSFIEPSLIFNHGQNIETTRIQDITINDSAHGYISKSTYPDGMVTNTRYICNIMSDGVFYGFNIVAQDGLITDEIATEIFSSIKIDSSLEKQIVNDYSLDIRDGRYYSQRCDGASIEVSEDFTFTESMSLVYNDSIMGLTLNDDTGTIVVRRQNKYADQLDTLQMMYSIRLTQIMNQGFVSQDDMDDIINGSDVETDRLMIIYPAALYFYGDYLIETEDAFYIINIMYYGDNDEVLNSMINLCRTFTPPGIEIIE